MKILVLGGTYFLGRAFVEMAAEQYQLTLVNRGNNPLSLPGVAEYRIDRHDEKGLRQLNGLKFDCVVDFCAYEKGDITFFLEKSGISVGQYLFISTCDVYRREPERLLREDAPFETRQFPGPEGAYITGKVALEQELREAGRMYGFFITSLRPSFIYGPGNYAPRESIYFNWILRAGQILHPTDATGCFQMVYVKDVARAILLSLGNPKALDKAFNLCAPGRLSYESFSEMLTEVVEPPFQRIDITVDTVLEKQIPLPFPLYKEESLWYDGSAVEELGLIYTDLNVGMRETYAAFQKSV